MDQVSCIFWLTLLVGSMSSFGLSIWQICALLVALVFVRYYIDRLMDRQRYPPGPMGLPFLGNFLSLAFHGPDAYMTMLYRKYGSIASLKLSNILNIVISDYEMIKELSKHSDFQARPERGLLHELLQGYGLLDTEGQMWFHQRRFIVYAMRHISRLQMEDKITSELANVVERIKNADGKAISIDMLLVKCACNIIFSLAFNKSYDYNDPKFIKRLELLDENVRIAAKTFPIALFPWLKPLFRKNIEKARSNINTILSFDEDFIKEHKQTLDKDNPRDLLDLYLIELQDKIGNISQYQQTFSEKQMKYLVLDLFAAGTETVSTTIKWGLLYMIHHPEIQQKVHEELDNIIGKDRAPTMADKAKMPYTMATIQEIERMATVLPRALPRSNETEASFKGFTFPARTLFTLNVYSVHRDPKLWDSPEEFRPSRFIKDGQVFRPPYLLSFGCGKRACAGEALGKMEQFLTFATLMQNFYFKGENGSMPQVKVMSGILRSPRAYKIHAELRN